MALENERAVFESMLAAGRLLNDEFEIQVNYTVATGSEPDVKLASTNCHNSHVLLRNYELDTTGQADRDELELVRSDIDMYASLIAFTKNLINSQAMVTTDSTGKATLLSPKPSPPPPPPPVPDLEVYAPVHPPAPPELVSGRALVKRYEEALIDSEAREGEIVLKLAECFVKDRADDTVCGFSSNEAQNPSNPFLVLHTPPPCTLYVLGGNGLYFFAQAPHPWMAKNNVKCRGYDTLQARQEDYCGYWESDVNPLAADRKLRKELLEVGPYCIDENDEVAYCSPNATRTQRSGVTDIEYMSRPDREYCEFKFARQRLTPEVDSDIEMCRANLTSRVARCHISCDACGAECTNNGARSLVSAYRCSLGLPVLGMSASFHSSDVGVDVHNRWGSKRTEGRPSAPDDSFQEAYRTMVQNSVDKPIAPRNALSCRKPHRESSIGSYTSPLNDEGKPVQRKGFTVECKTDLDCFSRCGSHPVSGMHYVCTHNVETYSLAGHSNEAYNQQAVVSAALRAINQPHPEVWLPDGGSKDFYLMNEPGDDKFDIQRGTGVCTDTHLDYGHTGCMDANGAKATMAISGCSGRAFGWSTFFCGVDVDYDEDYVTDVALSVGSLGYPRTLVEEAQVNGKTLMRVTCGDPFDCQAKCDRMERSARDGGLPAPSACSLCSPPCPTNIGTSIVMFVQAFRDDVVSAIKLAKICLNPTACVCQVSYLQTQTVSLLGTHPYHATGAGVHDDQARVDRQPAQRDPGLLHVRSVWVDPRQGGCCDDCVA